MSEKPQVRCATCRHWRRSMKPGGQGIPRAWRLCEGIIDGPTSGQSAVVFEHCPEGAADLFTAPDFFCAHWKPQEG